MKMARIGLALFLAAWTGFAAADGLQYGGSLGMAFPTGRLADSREPIGAKLLPAPGLGVVGIFSPLKGIPRLSCEGSIEANIFRSEDDNSLKVIYVPIQVAGIWGVGSTGGLDMQIRAGAGGGFLSANTGALRSLSGVAVSLGWRIGKDLQDLTCAFETGLDFLIHEGTQNIFRFKLLLLTR